MNLEEIWDRIRECDPVSQAGVFEVFRLAKILRERFGEVGRDAILTSLRRDIVQRGLDGEAALIYVRGTRILYESAEPLRY